MNKMGTALTLLALIGATPAAIAATPAVQPRLSLAGLESAKQFDRFIVKFRAGTPEANSASARQQALDSAAAQARQDIARSRQLWRPAATAPLWLLNHVRRMAQGADVVATTHKLDRAQAAALMRRIASNPAVAYVELDRILQPVFTPNDPNFPSQWGLTDADAGIRADQAWDLDNGAGVVVAIIDTGITSHSDLNANVLPGYDFVSNLAMANDGDGRDSNAGDPGDYRGNVSSSWHGTHVAGTVAAIGNNSSGVIGVAYGARILPVRVLGVGGGSISDIADGLLWAAGGSVPGVPANASPAEVANLSLGGAGTCSITMQNAINGAVALGTTVVVAAGNDADDAGATEPASCANVIAVASVSSNSARSSFSNFGTSVAVSAPGSSIISTVNLGSTAPAGEGYATYSGTSMATPHVAGTVALLQGRRVARGYPPYAPAAVASQLKSLAYPVVQGCTYYYGAGIPDARALLEVAGGDAQALSAGIAANSLAASGGNALYFVLPASAAQAGLRFASSGGSGNADLYVKFGAKPTTADYDCRSSNADNSESCDIASAQPGSYYAMLLATAAFSATSLTASLIGNAEPSAAFAHTATGLSVSFTDLSGDSDGSIASRNWNFGDFISTSQTNPVHAYSQAGSYLVQLTSTDNLGSSNCALRRLVVSPPAQALSNGIAVTGIAAKIGGELRYTLAVPAGASNLGFVTAGGSGDADLFVKFGAPPSLSDYDCVSQSPSTSEQCSIGTTQAGTYHVLLRAFSNFSSVALTGSYLASGNAPPMANFAATSNQLVATFTDSSSDSDGSIIVRNWNFGDGSTSTVANPVKTYAAAGTYNVNLSVTDDGGASASVSKPVTVSGQPAVSASIADVAMTETDSGTRSLSFRVSLSATAPTAITYDIATSNGSALAGSDYLARSLVGERISAGSSGKSFVVTVNGDTAIEPDETFQVSLSNVVGANVTDGLAIGTIRNNDCICLRIGDVSIVEGHAGTSTLTFTITLSQGAASNVTYNIATANSTATAGSDYVASSLSGQTIPAGQTSKTFSVVVNGDATVESNERFRVNVTSVSGATVSDGVAYGTIVNDD